MLSAFTNSFKIPELRPVSYTHLDVYKRQELNYMKVISLAPEVL